MFDVSPVSQKIKSQSLAKPSRKCSAASPTSILSAAWRSKKCRSSKWPQHSFGRLRVEGLSTFAAPQHRGPGGSRYPHRRRCTSHWQLRSTPPCVHSGPSAPSRWRWLLTTSPPADKCGWKRGFGARFEDFWLWSLVWREEMWCPVSSKTTKNWETTN